MTTGFSGGLLYGCKPLLPAGYVSLPCVKGGGTAYAVTEGLSHFTLRNNPNNPSAAAELLNGKSLF